MDFKTKQQLIFVLSAVCLVVVEGKAPVGEWTLKNTAGNVCMKMKMAATLTIPYATSTGQSSTAVVDVPTSADPTDYSKCEGDSVSFRLNFFYPKWEVSLDYKKSGSQYKLDTIGVGWTIDGHFPDATGGGAWFSVSTSDSSLPKTDIGKYYGCDNITFDVSGVTLALSDVKFQPYVQEVSDKGYGELAVCTNSGLSQAVAILIVVAVALVIIVPVVITIVCVVRRRRQNRQFDYQQQ